jgi:hypothetical protein
VIGGVTIMAIESIGSPGIAQFQPRNQQPSETDNNAVQSFVQNLQEAGRNQPQAETAPAVQTQTAAAVQQPAQSQQSERPGTAAAPSFQEFAAQSNEPQDAAERPEAGQNNGSALNYSASGATNSSTNPGQAGRLVSLSV